MHSAAKLRMIRQSTFDRPMPPPTETSAAQPPYPVSSSKTMSEVANAALEAARAARRQKERTNNISSTYLNCQLLIVLVFQPEGLRLIVREVFRFREGNSWAGGIGLEG